MRRQKRRATVCTKTIVIFSIKSPHAKRQRTHEDIIASHEEIMAELRQSNEELREAIRKLATLCDDYFIAYRAA